MPEKSDSKVKVTKIPEFKIDNTDRWYLAVARKNVDKLVMVYTLGCNRAPNSRSYELAASIDVAAFSNPRKAEIYYKTIEALIDVHKDTPIYQGMIDYNESVLTYFREKTK
ncbi:MAG: hypothetical protein J6T57_01630 [Alphaproteobacteria bacterium]|nr:hypothetical protein [Alphaproteobacteria bacterium]